MIIGYCLYGQDNDTYMIDEGSSLTVCPKCGFLKDFDYHNPLYKIKKKTYDFSHPYDFGNVVSLKFKEFCIRENYKNILFKEFERSFGFFQFYAKGIVEFDAERTGTEFKNYCEVCGNHEEAIGVTPPFLKDAKRLEDGFYRTDLLFGSKNAKSPIVIVGPDTCGKLKKEKMKGLTYVPIERQNQSADCLF